MATRMQQRKGTASQWTSANPILNAGEIGWESDTNKFKIGDGTNHWSSLTYFLDATDMGGSFSDYVPLTQKDAANGVASLDASSNVNTKTAIVFEGATADAYETTVQVIDPTADRTITIQNESGTVALLTNIPASTDNLSEGSGNKYFTDERAQDAIGNAIGTGLSYNDTTGAISVDTTAIQAKVTDVSDTEIGYLNGVTSAIQTQINNKLSLSGGTMTGAIAMGTSKITGLGTPTDAADAATKAYVDALGEGLHIHASVVAATTANITLATDVENGDTLDGVTLATGNRILVKNQSTTSQNGIYVVAASGAPSRAADFDSPAEIDGGDFVFVTGGTVNDNKGFVQVNIVGTVGTDPIEFTQFSGAGTFVAGNGLTLTDNSFSINTSITADLSTAQTLTNKTLTSPIVTGLTLNDSSIIIEGSSANDFETTLTVTDPTADRTITLPDATGTVALTNNKLDVFAATSSAELAGVISDETGTGALVFGTNPTITNLLANQPVLKAPEERWSVSATAATGTINLDTLTSGILYYTSNASANWTLNVRGNSDNTLNSMLSTNDSVTVVFFVTNGSTAYYPTGLQIDGSSVTPKWQNGTAPSAGNTNSIDIYSYTIVKTGNAAFTAFGSQTKFA
jgi:hypothetical protein